MNRFLTNAEWARAILGGAELGDTRRTDRLVRMASSFADAAGASPARASASPADAEGAYRLLRNDEVDADAITEAGCAATAAALASSGRTLLAIEDTTTLSYRHRVADELGDLGGRKDTKRRGFFVHTTLAVDAQTGATVGLLDQRYWLRETSKRGQRHQRKKRPYEQKESFKWQETAERLGTLMGQELMPKLISVCDREADIYQYLHYKVRLGERFVVRAARDRALEVESNNSEEAHLFPVMSKAPSFGVIEVEVPQRGGRVARRALVTLRATRLRLHPTTRMNHPPEVLEVNAILAREEHPPKGTEPLTWLLLTTEPIASQAEVLQVLHYYRLRWRIEEFHKAWKSGTGIEERRLQAGENIHRLAAILAFVAVLLLQLRELASSPEATETPCSKMLPDLHWKLLWRSVDKRKPLPKDCPSVAWAFRALGRLGGWKDSKRTGRVGWEAVWDGWFRLQERLDGIYIARELST